MALNVLVVDDSAVMRAMIIRTLELCGMPIGEIHQAGNGREGLAVLHEHWIDLVLVDINMPVMNGEEMLQAIRGNPETADTPVVVVSTEGSSEKIGMLQRRGAGFVHKPFSPEGLRDVLITTMGIDDERILGTPAVPGDGPDF